MKHRSKLIWSLLFILVLSTILAGCGSNNSTVNDSDKSNSSGSNEPAIVKITTARPVGSDYTFKDGEDIKNNVHNTWAKEELGIDIEDIWTTADNEAYHTKLRLSLSTNEPLPDAFIVQDEILIADLIESGKVLEISDAFEQYASERLKEMYGMYDSSLNQVRSNGGLYGLPIFSSGDGTSPVLWVRQDWLDALSLEAPTNMEEFEKVMDAFTNQDPDKNGKDDTIGFALSARDNFTNWMSDASFVFGAFTGNAIPGAWYEENGELKYGSVHPGMKQGLAVMKDWASKGYLDPEAPILDPIKATESFIQGRAGMVTAPWWSGGWPLSDLLANNPDAVLNAYMLPTGADGQSARFMNSLNEGKVMLFNKDFKHMDKFFEYFDRIYDYAFETGDFQYGYFEGYDYAMVDGKPVYDFKKFPEPLEFLPKAGKYNLFWNPPLIPFDESNDALYLHEGNEPSSSAQLRMSANNPVITKAGAMNHQMKDSNAPDMFMGAPTQTLKSKGANLDKMVLETFVSIVFSNASVDSFDTFVKDWFDKGGKDVTEEVNEWYQSVNQ